MHLQTVVVVVLSLWRCCLSVRLLDASILVVVSKVSQIFVARWDSFLELAVPHKCYHYRRLLLFCWDLKDVAQSADDRRKEIVWRSWYLYIWMVVLWCSCAFFQLCLTFSCRSCWYFVNELLRYYVAFTFFKWIRQFTCYVACQTC